jgi:hypothetical protein
MEADTEKIELDPGMMQSTEKHHEIPKEEAAVMPVRGLMKRHRLEFGSGAPPEAKGKDRGYCGSRKTVTITGRRIDLLYRNGMAKEECRQEN